MENLSVVNCLILGVLQIMTSSFHILMWLFLHGLYSNQIKGYFGLYNPITYKACYPTWAFSFFISGILSIGEAKFSSICLKKMSLCGNMVSASAATVGIILIIMELRLEVEVSYRNFARAILGRIVSSILLVTSLLEFSLTCTYIYYLLCNWDHFIEDNSIGLGSHCDIREVDDIEVKEEEKKDAKEPVGE